MALLQRQAGPLLRPLRSVRLSPRVSLGLLLALAAAFALLAVNQLSRTTQEGYAIDQLRRERALKQSENHALEAELARLSSLARVEMEARLKLGLTAPKRTEHIATDHAVPETEGTLQRDSQTLEDEGEGNEGGAPIWKRGLQLLPFY